MPDEEEGFGFGETEDESKYELSALNSCNDLQFAYDYDFGDNWEHALMVEKILPMQQGVHYPVCLAG